MSTHLKCLCLILLIQILYNTNFTISVAFPVRFFKFDSAPSPNGPPEKIPGIFVPAAAPLAPIFPPPSPRLVAPPLPAPPPQAFPPDTPPLRNSGGMNGGKKAGIVVGSLAGVALLVVGGIMYGKRRSEKRHWLRLSAMQPVFQVPMTEISTGHHSTTSPREN
ncbi:hypothetical protein M5689_001629 [Euphorbia peplus]|nr:hypothetical protein M5689_001629 [Euphorbia peplus]